MFREALGSIPCVPGIRRAVVFPVQRRARVILHTAAISQTVSCRCRRSILLPSLERRRAESFSVSRRSPPPPTPTFVARVYVADRTDETNRALEQKRDMVGQVQDMQRKVKDEQIGE